MEKRITHTISIAAPVSAVWDAWTTESGAKTFFAPDCKIELRVGGAYEMYFDPEGPEGERGGEGLTILAIQPKRMFSFTWNAPPSLPEVRGQLTHVTVYFKEIGNSQTELQFIHGGWGEGGQWDLAFEYFTRAWGEIVLPRLKQRFETGPMEWEGI